MSTQQQQPRVKRRPFPFVCVGQAVYWYPHGERTVPPVPAIVDQVGESAIDLVILDPDIDRPVRKFGVHHCDAPAVNEHIRLDTGGWEHTAFTNMVYGRFPGFARWPDEEPPKEAPKEAPKEPTKPPAA